MNNNELLYKLVRIEILWQEGMLTITEAKDLMHETMQAYLNNNN